MGQEIFNVKHCIEDIRACEPGVFDELENLEAAASDDPLVKRRVEHLRSSLSYIFTRVVFIEKRLGISVDPVKPVDSV